MHVVVTGSSGLVGTPLVKKLAANGHQVTRLVRRTPRPGEARWNPDNATIETAALQRVDAVVHLAGASIAGRRWTEEYKRTLLDSRLRGTDLIATTIAALPEKPSVMISASAIGFYGMCGDEQLDETSPAGDGFLADLCVQWEAATAPADQAGIRVVKVRSGIVLSGQGGALKKQLPLYRFGLGGRIGSGRQWQSWISIDDEVDAIIHLLGSSISGPVNLTAPNPVRQRDFAKALGRALHRPAVLATPAFAPKLVLGSEMATNLVVTGQRVQPTALLDDGYEFAYPTLEPTLAHVLG